MYDIRQGLVVGRLGGGAVDVVSCVDFNPVFGEVCAGSFDGRVRLFR